MFILFLFFFFFARPTDRPTFTRGRAMGSETFYWDGQNNSVLARYSPHEICGKTLTKLGEIRGRILAAEIPRDLGRILAAEIRKSRWPKSCRESRRDRGKNFVREEPSENLKQWKIINVKIISVRSPTSDTG